MDNQGDKSGYDCEFLKKPPKSTQSECPVCLLILREPYQVTCCGYAFCRVCIERIVLCPCCKAERFDKFEDKRLKRSLYEFKVYCSNKEQGCQWVGELGQLDNHLNLNPSQQDQLQGCQLSQIKCLHCFKFFLYSNIEDHQNNQCPRRPFSCEYCKEFDSCYEEVTTNHWPVCGSYPMPCTNKCGETLQRQNLDNHIANDCRLTIINCDFQHVGCEVRLPRIDINSHLENSIAYHQSLQAAGHKKITDQVAGLERILQQTISTLQTENRQLRQQVITLTQHLKRQQICSPVCPVEYEMTQFNQRKRENVEWSSTPFYTQLRGYKMCFRVRANGWGNWKGTHVSVNLYIMRGEFDDELKWPFRGSFEIKLLNQDCDEGHRTAIVSFAGCGTSIEAGARVTQREVSEIGRCKAGFVSHSALQQKYIKNNSLRFILTYYSFN